MDLRKIEMESSLCEVSLIPCIDTTQFKAIKGLREDGLVLRPP